MAQADARFDHIHHVIRRDLGNTVAYRRALEYQTDLNDARLNLLEDMVRTDINVLIDSSAPVEDTSAPVEDSSAPVNDSSPVEDTSAPVNDSSLVENTSALVEDTSAPVENTETEYPAPDSVPSSPASNSVPSSPAAIATGQYTNTVTILESNLGVGGNRGLASGTQAEALTSVLTSTSSTSAEASASASAVSDPVNKRNYDEYLDSESETDKNNKRVKTDSDSEPTGDAS